jgi:hypothetical protein
VTYQKLRNEEEGIIKSKGCTPRKLTGFQPSSSRKLQEAEKVVKGCGRFFEIEDSDGNVLGATCGSDDELCFSCLKKSACEKEIIKSVEKGGRDNGVSAVRFRHSPSQEAEKTLCEQYADDMGKLHNLTASEKEHRRIGFLAGYCACDDDYRPLIEGKDAEWRSRISKWEEKMVMCEADARKGARQGSERDAGEALGYRQSLTMFKDCMRELLGVKK